MDYLNGTLSELVQSFITTANDIELDPAYVSSDRLASHVRHLTTLQQSRRNDGGRGGAPPPESKRLDLKVCEPNHVA